MPSTPGNPPSSGTRQEHARCVLVDCEPALRALFERALCGVPVESESFDSAERALSALRATPAALVVADVSRAEASGIRFVQRIAEHPALLERSKLALVVDPAAPPVVEPAARWLRSDPAWRVLRKPVSPEDARACVAAAFREEAASRDADGRPPRSPVPGAVADALSEYFGGDEALFEQFRDLSVEQFSLDIPEFEQACAASDAGTARRVAHTLVSVLRMLGDPEGAALAAAIESAAVAGDLERAGRLWGPLRRRLLEIGEG